MIPRPATSRLRRFLRALNGRRRQAARATALIAALVLGPATAGRAQNVDLAQLGTVHPGFRIDGIDVGDDSGISVSGAGDVNGDGLADLIVEASSAEPSSESYVVFGKPSTTTVELRALVPGGFRIDGAGVADLSGSSVSGAGDVNGDGLADLIVKATGTNSFVAVYVVFGKANTTTVDLSALGEGGFQINGIESHPFWGGGVSGAGDVNGDGLADLIVGSPGAAPEGNTLAGKSHVVFGKASTTTVALSDLGAGGFQINGIDAWDRSGLSVSGAGDVNGDGLADLIVGAFGADPGGVGDAGESYVVFGRASTTTVDLSALGAGGFRIDGIAVADYSGWSVSGAGDVNGDGLADLILGAFGGDPSGVGDAGESYVVFGRASSATVDLSALGEGGFRIYGIDAHDRSGRSVSGAGDVDGDGLADLIVGAFGADPGGDSRAGESYVVFGKANATSVNLSDLGANGFRIDGIDAADFSGESVSGAGDVNGDGLADLIVGAPGADPGRYAGAGESYVVFSYFTPPPTATYRATAAAGNAPREAIGHSGDGSNDSTPDSRAWIDFADGAAASMQTVTLTRNNSAVENLPAEAVAGVMWEIGTNREGWTSAEVTFRYLNSDFAIVDLVEESLVLYTAASPSGPWTELPTVADRARNTLRATVTEFGFFAIGGEYVTTSSVIVR